MKELRGHPTKDKSEVMDILRLSYDSLPLKLKPCFLYFGMYPEDYEINAREMIQLWVAEGFVKPHEDAEPEVVADFYLDEKRQNVVSPANKDVWPSTFTSRLTTPPPAASYGDFKQLLHVHLHKTECMKKKTKICMTPVS